MLTIYCISTGNDDTADASVDSRKGIVYLGQHTAGDGAVGLIFIV